MTGDELIQAMLNEQFGIYIESSEDARELDRIFGAYCTFSICEYYETRGARSIVASMRYSSHILFSKAERWESALRVFCTELRPSSLFVGPPVKIQTIDELI